MDYRAVIFQSVDCYVLGNPSYDSHFCSVLNFKKLFFRPGDLDGPALTAAEPGPGVPVLLLLAARSGIISEK